MTKPAAQRFPTPPIDKLPDDIRTRILAVQYKSFFVPNFFLLLFFFFYYFRAFFFFYERGRES